MSEDANRFWARIVRQTYKGGYRGSSPLVIWKSSGAREAVPRASAAYGILVQHVGELKGQLADWRASLSDTVQGFHAVEFDDRYECHMDAKDPFKDPLGHLIEDSPRTLALIGAITLIAVAGLLAHGISRMGDR